jgi:hypothetical protein
VRIKWTRRGLLAGMAALFSSKAFKALAFSPGSSADTWVPGMRPFSTTSPANLPLPSGTIYTPVPWDPSTGFNYYTGIKFYYDIPAPSVTTVVSWLAPAGWGNPQQTFHRVMTPGFTGHGAGTNDPDNEAVSFAGNNCLSIFNFTRTSDTTATSGPYGHCNIVYDNGFGARGHGVGVVAAGNSLMLGALIKEEFTAGPINHMIGMSIVPQYCNAGTPNYYPPAINGDGNSGNGFIMEGQIMAIPPGTSMPSGLSIHGQKMFTAMQTYGVFIFDTSGSTTPYCGVGTSNLSTSWTGNDIGLLIKDVNILIPLLYKTGFPLDGLLNTIAIWETCGPQLQLVRYTGPLMHVTRDSDSTGQDFSPVPGASGLLDSTAISTFCSGTIGRVSAYYGQVTNVASFASAGSAAPIIYQSGAFKTINGHPALSFDGSSNYLKASGSSSVFPPPSSGTVYLNAVLQVTDRSANYGIFGSDAANGLELRIDSTTGFVRLLKNGGATIGVSSTAVALNAPTVIEATYNSTTGVFNIWQNRTQTATGKNLVAVTQGNILLGAGGPSNTDLFKGLIGSWLITSPYGMPARPQYVINHYQQNFWGTA